ncbi:Protein NRT1/ PTR FAMILY 2.13, partial [Mucuna pruriens]
MCSWISLFCCIKRNSISKSSLQKKLLDDESLVESEPETRPNKPGWKAMPYILGRQIYEACIGFNYVNFAVNETVERLAQLGIQINFMVYLMRVYNMDQVSASNVLNIWGVVSNVLPVVGAFVADTYLGKFSTIAIGSFAILTGMVIILLTSCIPQLHPLPCSPEQQQLGLCTGHTNFQLGVLLLGFFWLSIGTGGISPCSIPFAIDQFDLTTVEGRQGTRRFYNMYYVIQTMLMLINVTVVVKVQDSYSWALGYSLPTMFMIISLIFFFAGTKVYAYVEPEGSTFSRIAQVLVAAKRKRHIHLPAAQDTVGAFYDPPNDKDTEQKLPPTDEFR